MSISESLLSDSDESESDSASHVSNALYTANEFPLEHTPGLASACAEAHSQVLALFIVSLWLGEIASYSSMISSTIFCSEEKDLKESSTMVSSAPSVMVSTELQMNCALESERDCGTTRVQDLQRCTMNCHWDNVRPRQMNNWNHNLVLARGMKRKKS